MKEAKFKLGQTVYTVEDIRIGRFEIMEVIHNFSAQGEIIAYCLLNDLGRKVNYVEEMVYATLDEVREVARKNWNERYKTTNELLDNISDEFFDNRKKAYDEKVKAQKGTSEKSDNVK